MRKINACRIREVFAVCAYGLHRYAICGIVQLVRGVPSRFGPVDKSKNSAETHSGSSRTVNLGIAKDGIYHPLDV